MHVLTCQLLCLWFQRTKRYQNNFVVNVVHILWIIDHFKRLNVCWLSLEAICVSFGQFKLSRLMCDTGYHNYRDVDFWPQKKSVNHDRSYSSMTEHERNDRNVRECLSMTEGDYAHSLPTRAQCLNVYCTHICHLCTCNNFLLFPTLPTCPQICININKSSNLWLNGRLRKV